jgi:hypothetical protein
MGMHDRFLPGPINLLDSSYCRCVLHLGSHVKLNPPFVRSYQRYVEDHLQRAHTEIELITKKLEMERRRLFLLTDHIQKEEIELKEKRLRIQAAFAKQESVKHQLAVMRQLEGRLDQERTIY